MKKRMTPFLVGLTLSGFGMMANATDFEFKGEMMKGSEINQLTVANQAAYLELKIGARLVTYKIDQKTGENRKADLTFAGNQDLFLNSDGSTLVIRSVEDGKPGQSNAKAFIQVVGNVESSVFSQVTEVDLGESYSIISSSYQQDDGTLYFLGRLMELYGNANLRGYFLISVDPNNQRQTRAYRLKGDLSSTAFFGNIAKLPNNKIALWSRRPGDSDNTVHILSAHGNKVGQTQVAELQKINDISASQAGLVYISGISTEGVPVVLYYDMK